MACTRLAPGPASATQIIESAMSAVEIRKSAAADGLVLAELRKGEFKLDKLYIHPDVQRKGVGGQLIEHVAKRARKLGYPCVVLAVNKRNEKAIGSYKKYGFVVREAIVDDIGRGFIMDDFVMEKKL